MHISWPTVIPLNSANPSVWETPEEGVDTACEFHLLLLLSLVLGCVIALAHSVLGVTAV